MSKNIVALTVPFPGAKRPLEEGAKMGWWDLVMIDGQSVPVPDANNYILGAWHPVYNELVDYLVTRGKVCVMWTSSVGEVDFTPEEQEYLPSLVRDPRVDRLWFGDSSLARIYPEKGFFAWYPLAIGDLHLPEPVADKHDIFTLFCPTGPKKNILAQLVAVRIVQQYYPQMVLHTNVRGYDWLIDQMNVVRHDWLPDDDYRQLIGRSRLNLAVSYCETFNYQVAEAALLGTPSLISPTVPLPGIEVCDPSDAQEISYQIFEFLKDGTRSGKFREDLILLSGTRNCETRDMLEVN